MFSGIVVWLLIIINLIPDIKKELEKLWVKYQRWLKK